MDWVRPAGRVETLLDALTALVAAFAGGIVAFALIPVGVAGELASAIAGAGAGGAVLALMRRLGTRAGRFELYFELGELPETETDELLLDDPLEAAAADSRVVRLFAPEPIAPPGELADRIERWLGDARERVAGREPVAAAGGHHPQASAASAAFHSALADLRRSLR